MTRYFAFGSNMSSARLRERLPAARSCGRGLLRDWEFVCNKSGRDGSAKANMAERAGAVVWGAIYQLPVSDLDRLDAIEGGYERIEVDVQGDDGQVVRCQSYASSRITDDPRPLHWYRELIVAGAREHRLPAAYVAMLEGLTAVAARG